MNGILLLIISHLTIFFSLRSKVRARDLRPRLDSLRRALEKRDYSLQSLTEPLEVRELVLDACVRKQLRAGRLEMKDLDKFYELCAEASRRRLQSERFLCLLLLHAGLCLGLAIAVYLFFRQELWLSLVPPDPFLVTALFTYVLVLVYIVRQVPWPRSFDDEAWLSEFMEAWFGLSSEGTWALALESLRVEESLSGISRREARQEVLIDSWLEELNALESRLQLAEEWIGVGELVLASGLAVLLWLPALLERVSSLLSK